jgi:FkbM family methyltransferase
MSARFFSQNGEDYLLWRFFGEKPSGFYLDVGAFDGIHLSNTYCFELGGWSGICIEPHPRYFPMLAANRPRAICLHAACVADSCARHVTFYQEELGLLSGVGRNREADVAKRYRWRGLQFGGFHPVKVPATTLDRVLDEYLQPGLEVDFISIDVEGTEIQVLAGLNIARIEPRLLVVEGNSAAAKVRLLHHVSLRARYHLARVVSQNLIFARDKADVAPLRAIPIDCYIEPTTHPMGERFTLPGYLHGKHIRQKQFPFCLFGSIQSPLGNARRPT